MPLCCKPHNSTKSDQAVVSSNRRMLSNLAVYMSYTSEVHGSGNSVRNLIKLHSGCNWQSQVHLHVCSSVLCSRNFQTFHKVFLPAEVMTPSVPTPPMDVRCSFFLVYMTNVVPSSNSPIKIQSTCLTMSSFPQLRQLS